MVLSQTCRVRLGATTGHYTVRLGKGVTLASPKTLACTENRVHQESHVGFGRSRRHGPFFGRGRPEGIPATSPSSIQDGYPKRNLRHTP